MKFQCLNIGKENVYMAFEVTLIQNILDSMLNIIHSLFVDLLKKFCIPSGSN